MNKINELPAKIKRYEVYEYNKNLIESYLSVSLNVYKFSKISR